MARLQPLNLETTSGKTKEILEGVKSKLGRVPNIHGAMAHSPALLEGYLGLSSALGGGKLDPKLREFISLSVAEKKRLFLLPLRSYNHWQQNAGH